MSELLWDILKIVISAALTIVTLYLIPYLKSQAKSKQMEEVLTIVEAAVQAAEQTLKDGVVKKHDVIEFVTTWLGRKGITVSEEELDRLVESAVYAMNLAKGQTVQKPSA